MCLPFFWKNASYLSNTFPAWTEVTESGFAIFARIDTDYRDSHVAILTFGYCRHHREYRPVSPSSRTADDDANGCCVRNYAIDARTSTASTDRRQPRSNHSRRLRLHCGCTGSVYVFCGYSCARTTCGGRRSRKIFPDGRHSGARPGCWLRALPTRHCFPAGSSPSR